jgi:hypothetical protein
MKDSEITILKAFLYALSQQSNSLAVEITNQLTEISQSLETRVAELHLLATNNPSLKKHYENARLSLTSTAAQRGMGLNFLPANESENETKEIDNITRDVRNDIKNMEEILATIDSNLNQSSQILSASDPIQAIKKLWPR